MPIIKGYGNNGNYLSVGACTMKSNQVLGLGNYALASHYVNGNVLFHSLKNLKKNEYIYATDLNHLYQYKIIEKKIIYRTQSSVINNKSYSLITLITCVSSNPNNNKRRLVQGKLVNTYLLK